MGNMTIGEKSVLAVFMRAKVATDDDLTAAILTLGSIFMWRNFARQQDEWVEPDERSD